MNKTVTILMIAASVSCLTLVIYCIYGHLRITRVSQGVPIPNYETEASALLIIDMQRDATEPSGRLVMNPAATDRIIENLNAVTPALRKRRTLFVMIRHEWEENWILQILTNHSLRPGTRGSEVDPRIAVKPDTIITKQTSDSFGTPALDAYLRENKISHLYLSGTGANHCIRRTAEAALQRGYKVTVLRELVAGKTDAETIEGLQSIEKSGGKIASVESIR